MLRALRQLSVENQVILELFYSEEMSGREVAEIVDLPENTIRNRLNRARATLCETMERLTEEPASYQSAVTGLETWAGRIREDFGRAQG